MIHNNEVFRIVRFEATMIDPILHELQALQELQRSANPAKEAFALFGEELSRLKNAYSKLQERFDAVNQELGLRTTNANYLTHILKCISDAVLFVNLEGVIVLFNKAAEDILHMKKEQVLFKKFGDLFEDEHFGFSMKEALKFGISHKLLYRNELEISSAFVYEGNKAHHGMMVIFKDISEKQKLQLAINRNERMKELGKMVTSIAHEIRNPLGGIRGFASLLYRDLQKNAHLQEMASFIIEGTKNLETIVNAVLHYSKPIELQLTTQDLGAFIKQLARFIKLDPAFPSHVKLSLHVPDQPILVPFDRGALKGAMLNLIFNAIQAMPQGGELMISLLMIPPFCQISIHDTGVGIDEEMQKLLFSPFFTTKKGGNGLGLVEVEKIVQAHFGKIDVRSQLGKGSTFTIHLPIR